MSEFSEPKKETVRITLPPPIRPGPAGGEGSAHDTVRINVPEAPAGIGSGAESMQSAAIRPPLRPPMPPPPRPSAAVPPVRPPLAQQSTAAAPAATPPPLPPRPRVLPPPPRVHAVAPPAPPTNDGGSGSISGPKKETARISMLPEPIAVAPARPVKMTKTQPLMAAPPQQAPLARVDFGSIPPPAITAQPEQETIPMPLLWAACGISAVTLLIQIWNYFSS